MSAFWKDTNAEGLALAKERRWPEAERAFEDALGQLEAEFGANGVTMLAHEGQRTPDDRHDDTRAQLLLNIGQCQFHQGNLEQARRNAERSYAIRVSLYGEDSLIVARTRGDLAVILGASGLVDEAVSLLERAVSAVEKKRGATSAHLVPLLTNAARLLERTSPDGAQPFVARLKALQFAQQLADKALTITPTELPSHSFGPHSAASASDDHYLRSAIAETVNLLRTTPAANIALREDGTPNTRVVAAAESPVDESVERIVDDADDNIDDTIFDLVEAPPPTLSSIRTSDEKSPDNPLGFEVQYGIPEQLHEPLVEATPTPTPSSVGQLPHTNRNGIRAVGGIRRGSTQVVAPRRLWYIGVALVAFGAGIGLTYLIMPLLR